MFSVSASCWRRNSSITSERPAETMSSGTWSTASRASSLSAPGRGSILVSRTMRGMRWRGGWPCLIISSCALSHHATPSTSGLVAQSSRGANSRRKAGVISSEKPSMSWHWIESPVVMVASKSAMTSRLSSRVFSTSALRLIHHELIGCQMDSRCRRPCRMMRPAANADARNATVSCCCTTIAMRLLARSSWGTATGQAIRLKSRHNTQHNSARRLGRPGGVSRFSFRLRRPVPCSVTEK